MRLFDGQGNVHDIDIENIVCIKREVVKRKTVFYDGSHLFQDPNTLVQLAKAYQEYGFYQIDKNRLVNLNKVDEYKDGYLWINGSQYLISRRLKPIIKDILSKI